MPAVQIDWGDPCLVTQTSAEDQADVQMTFHATKTESGTAYLVEPTKRQ